MNPEDHVLMCLMFFKQRQAIRILLDILRSRDIITADDEKAFSSAFLQDADLNSSLLEGTRDMYLKIAQGAGVDSGLERLPKPPAEWFQV
jgi:hypothetical protein